jgi:hypothetical protein
LGVTRPVHELFGRRLGYGFAGFGASTSIGSYTEMDVDLSSPTGLLGLLDWIRAYNSLSTAVGPLGRGWTTAGIDALQTESWRTRMAQ